MKKTTLVTEATAEGWLYKIHPSTERLLPLIWFTTYNADDPKNNDIYKGALAWIDNQNVEVVGIREEGRNNLEKQRGYALEAKHAFLFFEKSQKGWFCFLRANRSGSGLIIWVKEHCGEEPIGSRTTEEAYEWARAKGIEIVGEGGSSYRAYIKNKKYRSRKKENSKKD